MTSVPRARDVWKRLNGVVCVFKPAGYNVKHVMSVLRHKLTQDLNAIEEAHFLASAALAAPGGSVESDPPRLRLPDPASSNLTVTSSEDPPSRVPSADHRTGSSDSAVTVPPCSPLSAAAPPASALNPRLVTGAAFLAQDVRLYPLAGLGRRTSGPLVLGLNRGTRLTLALRQMGPQLRVHHLTARLGVATDNLFADGKATDKATYGHVSRGKLEAVLSGLQAAHQRHMFESAGLPVNSQAAYELASRGPIRPDRDSPPVIYGLRCVQFAPPFFTLEVHAINETEQYLLTLVQDLGRQLRSAAVTVRSRCLRHGPFTLDHALLMKHWRLEHVRENIARCVEAAAAGLPAQQSGNLQPLEGRTEGNCRVTGR